MTITTPTTVGDPIDVWLREGHESGDLFEPNEAGFCAAEANTYVDSGGGYVVEWYLSAVGLVKAVHFHSYTEATDWLAAQGFEDYTS